MFRILRGLLLFLAFLIAGLEAEEMEHKIVYLVAQPRSLSTAFFRMVESRGDFTMYHEPIIPVYDKCHFSELTEGWFHEDSFNTFEEVKERLFASKADSHVFVKEMGFTTQEYVLKDPDFIKDPSVHFLFLVRNPHHAIISFYKKFNSIIPGMDDVVGLKSSYEIYTALRELSPNPVRIIFSEQLYNCPEKTMTAFCEHLDIPFTENMFTWKQYGEDFEGCAEWNEQKISDLTHYWHGRAIESTGLGMPASYEVDLSGEPTFAEIANEADREEVKQMYFASKHYYELFLEEAQDHLFEKD